MLHFPNCFSTYLTPLLRHLFSRAHVFVFRHRMQLLEVVATSALHLSGHRHRKIACRLRTSLGVGRGDNHVAPNRVYRVWSIFSHLYEVMRSWVWASECGRTLLWSKKWWHSAFCACCLELHTLASVFHTKQQSLFCLGAKILPRQHHVCRRIWCTRSPLLKTSL